MREIHLVAEYNWWPTWEYDEDQRFKDDYDPHELPISKNLADNLVEWAIKYSKAFDMNNPAASGFASENEASNFGRQGIDLAKQLQIELGAGFKVIVDFTADDFTDYVRT